MNAKDKTKYRTAKLEPKQYAEKRGVTLQNVTHALRQREKGRKYTLPGVTKVEKFSRFYVLHVALTEEGNILETRTEEKPTE